MMFGGVSDVLDGVDWESDAFGGKLAFQLPTGALSHVATMSCHCDSGAPCTLDPCRMFDVIDCCSPT